MIARTKNQKRIVRLDHKMGKDEYDNIVVISRIKPLGKRITDWAEKEVLKNRGHRNKSGTLNCLKCGHHWKSDSNQAWHDEILEIKCPGCKSELKVTATQKRTATDDDYFTYVTKIKEYQLIRTFSIRARYKHKEPATYYIHEAFRIYIREDGTREVIGRLRGGMFYSQPNSWQGEMILRHRNTIEGKYSEEGKLYPKWNLQDYVIRAGFNAYTYEEVGYTVSSMLNVLLTYSEAETVLKDDRLKLFAFLCQETKRIKEYWPPIKICIRNDYDMRDPRSYFDMIEVLKIYGKDLLNHKYVCPKNFRKAHDFWINKLAKKRKLERERQKREDKLLQIARDKELAKTYNDKMKRFAKFFMSIGELNIRPLMTLEEVRLAGEQMHHCIYRTTSYWQEENNLLLGSYLNGKLIETTQYKLKERQVVHSYGVLNKPSVKHKEIVGLIRNSVPVIDKMYRSKKKKAKVL